MLIIPRIVNGEIDNTINYPFFVSISVEGRTPFCGGSYIGKNVILTAAHCLIKYKTKVNELRVSFKKKNVLDKGIIYKVKKIIIFEKFNRLSLSNDIGIIFLEGNPQIKHKLVPINLPNLPINNLYKNGNKVNVIGFGAPAYQKSVSLNLKKILIPICSSDPKKNPYPNIHIIPSRIFAGGSTKQNNIKDACQGDSGGPLFANHKNKIYLLGIVSCGIKCGQSKYPGIYTKVFHYRNWIKEKTGV